MAQLCRERRRKIANIWVAATTHICIRMCASKMRTAQIGGGGGGTATAAAAAETKAKAICRIHFITYLLTHLLNQCCYCCPRLLLLLPLHLSLTPSASVSVSVRLINNISIYYVHILYFTTLQVVATTTPIHCALKMCARTRVREIEFAVDGWCENE